MFNLNGSRIAVFDSEGAVISSIELLARIIGPTAPSDRIEKKTKPHEYDSAAKKKKKSSLSMPEHRVRLRKLHFAAAQRKRLVFLLLTSFLLMEVGEADLRHRNTLGRELGAVGEQRV